MAVEAQPGHDIGIVSLTGDMVAKQMRRVGFNPHNGEFRKIFRKARPYDIERWQEAIALEHETMIASRQIAAEMGLDMKIGDVEYQGDKLKAIFYYIADQRVDFRELIKVFAERFHIRIEMKQIGARQEAGRIGGIGACGRELCCASWMPSFSSVTTNAARMQEISLNPQKLAGQCSKLKCCLMYEYDSYADARRTIPRLREPLQTLDGEYHLIKIDPLAGTMSFSTSKNTIANLTTLSTERVKAIIAMNRAGEKPESLIGEDDEQPTIEPTYRSEEDSIDRFDNKSRRNKRNKRNKGNKRGNEQQGVKENTKEVAENIESGATTENKETKEQGERTERTERNDRPRRKERRERGERNERPERTERTEKPEHTERVERNEATETTERGEGGERTERGERHNRNHYRGRNNRGRHNRNDNRRPKEGNNNGGGSEN